MFVVQHVSDGLVYVCIYICIPIYINILCICMYYVYKEKYICISCKIIFFFEVDKNIPIKMYLKKKTNLLCSVIVHYYLFLFRCPIAV